MATVTNWVEHLTASEVAGSVYPYVGTELWWVFAGIIYWIWWTIATATGEDEEHQKFCLLYTSPSPRDGLLSRMPSSA